MSSSASMRLLAGRLPKAVKQFREDNRGFTHERRAAIYGVFCNLSSLDLQAWVSDQPKNCFWCGDVGLTDWHLDHFIPMSKGGPHCIDNLVIACPDCNLKKSDADPLAFASRIGVAHDAERYRRVVSTVGGEAELQRYARPKIFRLHLDNYTLEGCSEYDLALSVLLPVYKREIEDCTFCVINPRGLRQSWRVLVSPGGWRGLITEGPQLKIIDLPSKCKPVLPIGNDLRKGDRRFLGAAKQPLWRGR